LPVCCAREPTEGRSRLGVRVDYEKLGGDRLGEASEAIRARVQAACNI
jgi:hypothetical protein